MRTPTDSQRVFIAGSTGSGKTTEALHQLSDRSIDEMPWLLMDFKFGEGTLGAAPVTRMAEITAPPPTDPGVYAVRVSTDDCERGAALDMFFDAVLTQGNTGILVDEGQKVGQHSKPLRRILTQGRELRVPVIFLSQRPAFVDTHALSESEFMQLFQLRHPDDLDRIERYVPSDLVDRETLRRLPAHHSIWVDMGNWEVEFLQPCPPFQQIYDRILFRLPRFEDPTMVPPEVLPRRVRV